MPGYHILGTGQHHVVDDCDTYGGEDCQGEHQGAAEGPDPHTRVIPCIALPHILNYILLEPWGASNNKIVLRLVIFGDC